MSLNPTGYKNYTHNFTNPNKEGYNPQLVGTVAAIQEVQKTVYNPNPQAPRIPEFWPDGNPKWNIRLALINEFGEIETFTFQPAGKAAREGKKPSVHLDLFHLTEDTDMMNLIGKTIFIQTKEPPQGFSYGQGNPRPWYVGLVDVGPFQYKGGELPAEFKVPQVLMNNAVSGGQYQPPQIQQPQQYQYQQAPQPMQPQPTMAPPIQGFYQQPTAQQPIQQPIQQPQVQKPIQQPQYPQGMNPQIAQAMQAVGAMTAQEVPVGEIYDDIPFE